MNWTTKLPTNPGWYWVYRYDTNQQPEIVHVTEWDELLFVTYCDGSNDGLLEELKGHLWNGPLIQSPLTLSATPTNEI